MKLGEVTLVKDCMICHSEVILIARRDIKSQELPEKGSILPQVCGECTDKYLKEGVLLINPETGSLAVITIDCFNRLFDVPVPQHHIAFTEEKIVQWLINQNGETNEN